MEESLVDYMTLIEIIKYLFKDKVQSNIGKINCINHIILSFFWLSGMKNL